MVTAASKAAAIPKVGAALSAFAKSAFTAGQSSGGPHQGQKPKRWGAGFIPRGALAPRLEFLHLLDLELEGGL